MSRFVPTFTFRTKEPDADEELKKAIARARPEFDGFAEDPQEEVKPSAPVTKVSTVLPGAEGVAAASLDDSGDFFLADLSEAKLTAHDAGVTANEVLQSALHDLQRAFQLGDEGLLEDSQHHFSEVFTAQNTLISEVTALRSHILGAERSVGEAHDQARSRVATSLKRVGAASDALRFYGEKLSATVAARSHGQDAAPTAEAARSAMIVLVNLKQAALAAPPAVGALVPDQPVGTA